MILAANVQLPGSSTVRYVLVCISENVNLKQPVFYDSGLWPAVYVFFLYFVGLSILTYSTRWAMGNLGEI